VLLGALLFLFGVAGIMRGSHTCPDGGGDGDRLKEA